MEASASFLSSEELAALPTLVRAQHLGPNVVLLWYHDGSQSVATRAPSGELWVDKRSAQGQVLRADARPLHTSPFAPRASGSEQGSVDTQTRIVTKTAGTVARVHVSAGASVAEGELLLTIELMKMELHIKAPRACTVESVEVAQGQALEKGALLMRLLPGPQR
jgi:3-methylcrotonyl-CoA carboxylase alpha subunit